VFEIQKKFNLTTEKYFLSNLNGKMIANEKPALVFSTKKPFDVEPVNCLERCTKRQLMVNDKEAQKLFAKNYFPN
jgi:hypothetical protein